MKTLLRRFGGVILGVLSGFDRLVFKGKLRLADPATECG